MIEGILEKYQAIIISQRILLNRKDNQISEFKARLTFKDDSILEFSEVVIFGIAKRKYLFQWMNHNFKLFLRWDNAFHHRHITTFPHHKHIGDENLVEASEEMTLEKVLSSIEKHLSESPQ
jgi:Family of unknown function (DUF6516)